MGGLPGDPEGIQGSDHHADGQSDERDEQLGFDLGVDDYISKPFSPKILVARVEAILRRSGASSGDEVLKAGGVEIDKANGGDGDGLRRPVLLCTG